MTGSGRTSKRKSTTRQARSAVCKPTVSANNRCFGLTSLINLRAVGYLERQLQRAMSLNPTLADDLNREAPAAAKDDENAINDE